MTPVVVLAVEFDGALVVAGERPLRWRLGAREFVLGAAAAGVRLVLHSARAATAPQVFPGDAEEFYATGRALVEFEAQWALFDEMRAFLQVEGVWGLLEVWQAPGKPAADRYLDARGAPPNFVEVAAEMGIQILA